MIFLSQKSVIDKIIGILHLWLIKSASTIIIRRLSTQDSVTTEYKNHFKFTFGMSSFKKIPQLQPLKKNKIITRTHAAYWVPLSERWFIPSLAKYCITKISSFQKVFFWRFKGYSELWCSIRGREYILVQWTTGVGLLVHCKMTGSREYDSFDLWTCRICTGRRLQPADPVQGQSHQWNWQHQM